jgi:tripartite-type tricarboxylate transporter receptor subunit TctC
MGRRTKCLRCACANPDSFAVALGRAITSIARRRFLLLAVAAGVLPALPSMAQRPAYPSRPVRIVVGFAAGGGSNIATEVVVTAPADGYTLLLTTTANAVNTTLYNKLSFDFVRDVAPVAGLLRGPNVMLVHGGQGGQIRRAHTDLTS